MKRDLYRDYAQIEDRHWWFIGRRKIFLALLEHELPSRSSWGQILDVGCGTGTMVGHMGSYGEAVGLEPDHEQATVARSRGVEVIEAGVPPIPFEDQSFDLVTALDVVEHLDDDRHFAREALRVLRPGGHLLVSVPAYQSLWGLQDEVAHHRRRYRRGPLEEVLVGSGFELVRVTYLNTFLAPPVAAVRLFRRLPGVPSPSGSDFDLGGDGLVNRTLARVFGAEARWLERHRFPFGISVAALVRKPE